MNQYSQSTEGYFGRKSKRNRPMNEPEYIGPKQLRLGPIRHESLSPELLERIRAVYDVIGTYFDSTLENFELNFRRDFHPESEVTIWMSITAAWISYHEIYLNNELLPDEEERKILGALLVISLEVTDVTKMEVSEDVGSKLLECFTALDKKTKSK